MINHNRASKYKGVSWRKQNQKWCASVTYKGQKIECGFHEDEREAAKMRDRKILALGLDVKLQVLKPKL